MILDKPPWISHGGQAILSIDVQKPLGSRVATAGVDGKVKIWNSLPLVSGLQEDDAGKLPRLLATLSDHFGPVNVARFARSSDLLASGSDDKQVCIYELRTGPGAQSFGSNEGRSAENWKVLHSCVGHRNNVTDLAWSPDDKLVATCSLDNTVMVWDVKTGIAQHKLEGHTSYVKGIAWDPIGKYLASQSDDRSIMIWRTADWSLYKKIVKPFVPPNNIVTNTFSLRIDWSPDGQCLAAVNSYKSPQHTAPLIERQSWDCDYSLVGHAGAVLCAKHSPTMFVVPAETNKTPSAGQPPNLAATCIAISGQDKRITVWLSALQRPICAVKGAFKQGPVDISWAPCGRTFLACSPDGTVAVVQLTPQELEFAELLPDEMDKRLEQLYGDMKSRPALLPESAEQLQLEADAQAASHVLPRDLAVAQGLAARLAPPPPRPPVVPPAGPLPPSKQLESRTNNGRRRIEAVPVTQGAAAAAPVKDALPPRSQAPASSAAAAAFPASARNGGAAHQSPARLGPRTGAASPLQQLPAGGERAHAGDKRKAGPLLSNRPTKQAAGVSSTAVVAVEGHPETAVGAPPASNAVFAAVVPIPTPAGPFFADLGEEDDSDDPTPGAPRRHRTLEATHVAGPGDGKTQLRCFSKGEVAWCDLLLGRVTAVGGNLHYCAVGLQDGSLMVYSKAGRRIFPALQLGAAPAIMASDKSYALLVVCTDGSLRLWDLKRMQLLVSTSALPILGHHNNRHQILKARISKTGCPQLVLSNSTASLYHLGMKEWIRVSDPGFPTSAFASIMVSKTTGGLLKSHPPIPIILFSRRRPCSNSSP
eukprot:jgi/Botrbrau1/9909/Bobra.0012s0010.2